MGDPCPDVVAVIMAGGRGARFGDLGRRMPKCLLPLPGGETLLTRLAGQLQAAGIGRTIVCCSPENISSIREFLESHCDATGRPIENLKAISCASCELGPLPALAEALFQIAGAWRLFCLGDVFFASEPFSAFVRHSDDFASVDGCLLTGTDRMLHAGSGTGAVACDGAVVRAISYRPFGPDGQPRPEPRRWSGACFLREALHADLNRHLSEYHQAPFENWIQGALGRGASCTWIEAGEFVNMNSAPDYEFLMDWAGHLASGETYGGVDA